MPALKETPRGIASPAAIRPAEPEPHPGGRRRSRSSLLHPGRGGTVRADALESAIRSTWDSIAKTCCCSELNARQAGHRDPEIVGVLRRPAEAVPARFRAFAARTSLALAAARRGVSLDEAVIRSGGSRRRALQHSLMSGPISSPRCRFRWCWAADRRARPPRLAAGRGGQRAVRQDQLRIGNPAWPPADDERA